MLPMIISGVSFGVIFNVLMPSLVVIGFYIVYLGVLGYGVFKKARKLRAAEIKSESNKNDESFIINPDDLPSEIN